MSISMQDIRLAVKEGIVEAFQEIEDKKLRDRASKTKAELDAQWATIKARNEYLNIKGRWPV